MKTIFKIEDGREKFYQWDLNRKILVEDDSITQVHFANAATPTAYVVSVSAGTANVPNIILQQNFDIKVYGYDKEFTKYEETFEVEKRSKPQDYVYTETEILNYETLANEVKEVKENIGESIQDYLKENPISVDLSDYAKKEDIPSTTGLATEKYVNEKVAAIPQPDLTGYAKREDVEGLASKGYVQEQIKAIPAPDLSEYAKKNEIPSTTGLATEQYVNNKVQGLASTDYVDQAVAAVPQPDLSNYYTKTEVDNAVSYVTNSILREVEEQGYQTAAQVNTAISNALNAIGVAEGRTY